MPLCHCGGPRWCCSAVPLCSNDTVHCAAVTKSTLWLTALCGSLPKKEGSCATGWVFLRTFIVQDSEIRWVKNDVCYSGVPNTRHCIYGRELCRYWKMPLSKYAFKKNSLHFSMLVVDVS